MYHYADRSFNMEGKACIMFFTDSCGLLYAINHFEEVINALLVELAVVLNF